MKFCNLMIGLVVAQHLTIVSPAQAEPLPLGACPSYFRKLQPVSLIDGVLVTDPLWLSLREVGDILLNSPERNSPRIIDAYARFVDNQSARLQAIRDQFAQHIERINGKYQAMPRTARWWGRRGRAYAVLLREAQAEEAEAGRSLSRLHDFKKDFLSSIGNAQFQPDMHLAKIGFSAAVQAGFNGTEAGILIHSLMNFPGDIRDGFALAEKYHSYLVDSLGFDSYSAAILTDYLLKQTTSADSDLDTIAEVYVSFREELQLTESTAALLTIALVHRGWTTNQNVKMAYRLYQRAIDGRDGALPLDANAASLFTYLAIMKKKGLPAYATQEDLLRIDEIAALRERVSVLVGRNKPVTSLTVALYLRGVGEGEDISIASHVYELAEDIAHSWSAKGPDQIAAAVWLSGVNYQAFERSERFIKQCRQINHCSSEVAAAFVTSMLLPDTNRLHSLFASRLAPIDNPESSTWAWGIATELGFIGIQ